MLSRRGFLSGLLFVAAAPAIVRFDSIMPVRAPPLTVPTNLDYQWLTSDYYQALTDFDLLVQKRRGNLLEEQYALDFARRLSPH